MKENLVISIKTLEDFVTSFKVIFYIEVEILQNDISETKPELFVNLGRCSFTFWSGEDPWN